MPPEVVGGLHADAGREADEDGRHRRRRVPRVDGARVPREHHGGVLDEHRRVERGVAHARVARRHVDERERVHAGHDRLEPQLLAAVADAEVARVLRDEPRQHHAPVRADKDRAEERLERHEEGEREDARPDGEHVPDEVEGAAGLREARHVRAGETQRAVVAGERPGERTERRDARHAAHGVCSNRESGIRNQESGIRNQESGIRNVLFVTITCYSDRGHNQ